jgi:hypothetical protein
VLKSDVRSNQIGSEGRPSRSQRLASAWSLTLVQLTPQSSALMALP